MNVNQTNPICTSTTPRRTKSEFPIKVYAMLELADNIFEFAQAVTLTWLPHGRAFQIHDKVKFMKKVVPVFFNQTKIRSFNRHLYMWGFRRIGRGDEQVWHHDNFLRGKPVDMKHMTRTKIKGKAAVSNEDGNLTGDTNHQMVWPNTGGSQLMMTHCVTAMHYHLPLLPADTIESTQPTHQARTSVVEPSYPTYSHMLLEDVNDFCFNPPKQNKKDGFEPLPFMDDNDNAPCDDFASFIEGAIKLIGE